MSAFRRIRFGGGRVSHDEARSAFELRALLWHGRATPGESSLHVASGLARKLVPYQFHAKLYRVPFEAIQREIVRYAPEDYRVLLYRRMMLRIAEALARRDRAWRS